MLLAPQTAAAASHVIWLCFGFRLLLCLLKDVLIVLVGSEPVLGGAFCFLFVWCFCFLFCFACRNSSGGARPRCVAILPRARSILSSPLWSSLAIRSIFRCICFPFFSSFFVLFSFLYFLCSLVFCFFSSFNISRLLACLCCTCRVQYDDMALHCLLPLQHCDGTCYVCVVALCPQSLYLSRMKTQKTQNSYGVCRCWMSTSSKKTAQCENTSTCMHAYVFYPLGKRAAPKELRSTMRCFFLRCASTSVYLLLLLPLLLLLLLLLCAITLLGGEHGKTYPPQITTILSVKSAYSSA